MGNPNRNVWRVIMNNLIINRVDHSQFDLEWVKHGGVVKTGDNRFIQFIQAGSCCGKYLGMATGKKRTCKKCKG